MLSLNRICHYSFFSSHHVSILENRQFCCNVISFWTKYGCCAGTSADDVEPSSISGKIVECSWNKQEDCWFCMRIRADKSTPNDINTYRKAFLSPSLSLPPSLWTGLISWTKLCWKLVPLSMSSNTCYAHLQSSVSWWSTLYRNWTSGAGHRPCIARES